MDFALDPLDLIKHTNRIGKLQPKTINAETLAQNLEEIAQEAAQLINGDFKKEFLYRNPNGWQSKIPHDPEQKLIPDKKQLQNISEDSFVTFASTSFSTSSADFEIKDKHWTSIFDFEFHKVVQQINEFIQTWELSPATKFVVISLDKIKTVLPFGKRHFVEAHFSKPMPKCPNPLAVAKVYFQVSVSHLLPKDYPINVTYKFEGYKTKFYAMGERKISSNKFQRYFIDSILNRKLSFYAKLCERRNPLVPTDLVKRRVVN